MSRANVAGLLDGPARWAHGRPAVLLGDEPVRTWGEFAVACARRAAGLRDRLSVAPGDTVGLFAANCPQYLEILFSIWHAGAVAVPISSRLHPLEAVALLETSRTKACFATEDVAADLERCTPSGTPIVLVGSQEDSALLACEPMGPVARGFEDDAWIFFTSGTTGRAKGARISHGNLLAMTAAYHADVSTVSPRDAFVHVAALSHASGLLALPFIGRGAAQVLPPSGHFEPAELLALIELGERSSFFVPPTALRRLCDAQQLASAPVDRIGTVLVGATPVRPGELRAGVGALGPRLWNGYGQGETPCTITALGTEAITSAVESGDDERLGSVGIARFNTRVRVVGPDDEPLPEGEVGEVVVNGPTVMAGYLGLAEASSEALLGGWLHTGDLGRFGPDGHLTLVDRVKDVVITGGYNVYPREVEDVLLGDASVADAAVVGIPDDEWGERVVAYLVPAPGASLEPGALDRLCLERIARHKRPKEYRIVPELPRSPAGKVLKKALREQHGTPTAGGLAR